MNYIIKFMDGNTLEITEEDFKNIMESEGLVAIKSVGQVVNMSTIARIVPKNREDELWDRKNQKEGILHDGTPVIRHFGIWYLDGEFDEKGNPLRHIDPEYYPEVSRDAVPLREEFETKYRHLPRKERLKLICEGTRDPKSGRVKQIGDIIKNKIK